MSRGTTKKIGDHFTNQNGYTYEKREEGWVPIHICIAEANLGRRLEPNERAYYVDSDRTNHDPKNVGVKTVYNKQSPQARLVALDVDIQDLIDKLEELRAKRTELLSEIASQSL